MKLETRCLFVITIILVYERHRGGEEHLITANIFLIQEVLIDFKRPRSKGLPHLLNRKYYHRRTYDKNGDQTIRLRVSPYGFWTFSSFGSVSLFFLLTLTSSSKSSFRPKHCLSLTFLFMRECTCRRYLISICKTVCVFSKRPFASFFLFCLASGWRSGKLLRSRPQMFTWKNPYKRVQRTQK